MLLFYPNILTGRIKYKNSSPSVGTITHGFDDVFKQSLTNSSLLAFKLSKINLGLKAIVTSLPFKTAEIFSLIFPISEFDVSWTAPSLMSNFTKLFCPTFERSETLSRAS